MMQAFSPMPQDTRHGLTWPALALTLKRSMKRRVLTSLLGTAAVCLGATAPGFSARAGQEKGVRRIGWLSLAKGDSEEALRGRRLLYEATLRAGYDERANLVVERRYAEGDSTRLPALADELVRLEVELIIAVTNEPIAAARQATRKIPIVMLGASSPVDQGFVASLAHPGANVTGTASDLPETAGRMLQVLKEAAPAVVRVAVLFNPKSPVAQRFGPVTERAARALGLQVDTYDATRPQDIAGSLKRIVAHRMDALYVVGDGVINSRLPDIAAFALKHKLVSIGSTRQFVEAGGMLYCGPDVGNMIERTVSHVERILKGAKPGELPVEQSARYELIVNQKTAQLLGRTVPQPMLLRANEVIE